MRRVGSLPHEPVLMSSLAREQPVCSRASSLSRRCPREQPVCALLSAWARTRTPGGHLRARALVPEVRGRDPVDSASESPIEGQ